jgi:hypothetical protein
MLLKVRAVRVLSHEGACDYVGGRENLNRLLRAGWVKPLAGKKKAMDFDVRDLDTAIDRVRLSAWPEGGEAQ